jgi:uroporphyrinogen-III synthase
LPTIEIKPLHENWLHDLPNLNQIQQAIFISANAVKYFFNTLKKHNIVWPNNIEITAIGHATAIALDNLNIKTKYIPKEHNSECLLQLDNLQNVKYQNILLIKGLGGREIIENKLNALQANLTPIIVYKRIIPSIEQEFINSLWQNDSVDIILFTSSEAMHNIFSMFGQQAKEWLLNKPCIVISARIAINAKDKGIKRIITSQYRNLIKALEGFKNES